jgi:(R)-amidase
MKREQGISRRSFLETGTVSIGALTLGVRQVSAEDPASPPDAASGGPVRVTVVQQDSAPGAVEENRRKALNSAETALKAGADIILFHEELLVGYVDNLKDLAEPVDGPTSQAFQTLLSGSESLILWGLTERNGDKFHISATLVGASGVVANYRKTHLWWKATGLRHEPTFYEAGNELVTFPVKGHKCGVMICYDGDFPEMTRAYAQLDCRMLFWLNNRGSRGHSEVVRLAESNSMIMAVSCVCGRNERGDRCRGGSNITNFDGKLLAEIWDEPGIIYATVDPACVPAARDDNPWYRGRRSDLY